LVSAHGLPYRCSHVSKKLAARLLLQLLLLDKLRRLRSTTAGRG
jgi:hypothetical protein